MAGKCCVCMLSILALGIAGLLYLIQDDMTLKQTDPNTPQKHLPHISIINSATLERNMANGYTHLESSVTFDHYPPITTIAFLDRFRIKMWDYFYLVSGRHMIGFSINQVFNFGSGLFMLYDTQDPKADILHHTAITLSNYKLQPYTRSSQIEASFTTDELKISYESPQEYRKIIRVEAPIFNFTGNFIFNYKTKNHHSITTIFPASDTNRVNFNFGTKVYGINVEGEYHFQGKRYEVEQPAVAMHDHGRGTPPYKTMWVWGSINTRLPDGRTLGVNMGTGDKPGLKATTDAIFIDGLIHKLGVVNVYFDNEDVLKEPWIIKTVSEAPPN